MTVPNFGDSALCAQTDSALFFPEDGQGASTQIAKRICQRCPKVAECLAWALKHDEHGVWGGTTENERRAIQMGRGITPRVLNFDTMGFGRDSQVATLTAQGLTAEEIATTLRTTRRSVERIRSAQRTVSA